MAKEIKNIEKGGESLIYADRANELIDALNALMNCTGDGVFVMGDRTAHFRLTKAALAALTPGSFQLVPRNDLAAGKVRVLFGQISPQLGTVMTTGVHPWPSGMTEGDNPQYIVTITGTTAFYLIGTPHATASEITSVSIALVTDGSVPENSCYLGTADLNTGKSFIVDADGRRGVGTQKAMVCGGKIAFWT